MCDYNSIGICIKVAKASTNFEINNSNLKKAYLNKNIVLYNGIVKIVEGYCGSFGTGYPFYALKDNFEGQLPVINEQIRYNDELISAVSKSQHKSWPCANCLQNEGKTMPDLKQVCKICKNVDDELKPRKVINRLPDIDMWMVCDTSCITEAKERLITLFEKNGMKPSDINPIETFDDIFSIIDSITRGQMPDINLPIDSHIISYEELYSLIEKVPYTIKKASDNHEIPYLAIHPISYRKKWQYDDVPYNFIHDYLSSLTEFEFKKELKEILIQTRKELVSMYTTEQLYNYLILCGPSSVYRRHETKELKKVFEERTDTWRRK